MGRKGRKMGDINIDADKGALTQTQTQTPTQNNRPACSSSAKVKKRGKWFVERPSFSKVQGVC